VRGRSWCVSFWLWVVVGKSCIEFLRCPNLWALLQEGEERRWEIRMVSERQEKADREEKSKNQKSTLINFAS